MTIQPSDLPLAGSPASAARPGSDRRERLRHSYRAGAHVTRERMRRDAPEDAAALEAIRASDIVVVPGVYDHVERVLDALELPYTRTDPSQLFGARLRPEQLVIVNCPGRIGPAARTLADFVAAGGSLFTTDWALRHVIEHAFPGTIAFNGRATADDVVRIEIREHDNPFLDGVLDADDDPLWWLEASSYPIRVLDRGRVQVLIASGELADRYGEAPVAVTFPWGDGEAFHMISHYYLQRTDLRSDRHRQAATAYAAEKDVAMPAPMAADLDGLTHGEVQSAATSAHFLAHVAAAKKRGRRASGAG